MMPNHYIFTFGALKRCLETQNEAWFQDVTTPSDGSRGLLAVHAEDCTFIIDQEDAVDSPRVILIAQDGTPVSSLPAYTLHNAFYRVHRVALGAAQPPLRLPPAWSEFRQGRFLAFFATSYGVQAAGLRWIAEIHPLDSKDVCFWKLTGRDDPIRLEHFRPEYEVYRAIVDQWPKAYAQSRSHFAAVAVTASTALLEPAIDFEATTFGPVTQHRTYSSWIEHLNQPQQQFLNWSPDSSVKLRGPAGSGKTLALELKCLHELYRARDKGSDVRILFATNSWAVAEQVDAALHMLDERGGTSGIDVYPLLEIARSRVPIERRPGAGFELLGEDSLSGRRLQLRRLDSLVDHINRSDWLTYRRGVSPAFRTRVEARAGSVDRNAFVWDLMVEFSSVLAAERILPGVNGERRYIALARDLWMMPLTTEVEKRVVFQVYTEYITGLADDRLLTADQLISDFLNYLETFTWNLLRDTEGYDLVFVDELHLFTEQERVALHYLTRPASGYPRLFMAVDPRQAPSEIYAGVPVEAVARAESGRADLDLGQVESVELTTVHRFTPEILGLVQHIHRRYPALNLGPDWKVDLESVQSTAAHGEKPTMFLHATRDAEMAALVQRVDELFTTMRPEERLALIVIDALQLPAYGEGLAQRSNRTVRVVQSRDDVGMLLRYSRRSLIVSAAEYLAGLQFDSVLIAGLPISPAGVASLDYQRRRLLTLLYLAVSRATQHVELHANDEEGALPRVLEEAVKAKVLERR